MIQPNTVGSLYFEGQAGERKLVAENTTAEDALTTVLATDFDGDNDPFQGGDAVFMTLDGHEFYFDADNQQWETL